MNKRLTRQRCARQISIFVQTNREAGIELLEARKLLAAVPTPAATSGENVLRPASIAMPLAAGTPGHTLDTAENLGQLSNSSQNVSGYVGAVTLNDYYTFHVQTTTDVRVSVVTTGTQNSQIVLAKVVGGQGSTLASGFISSRGGSTDVHQVVPPGVYYFDISSTDATYAITLTTVALPSEPGDTPGTSKDLGQLPSSGAQQYNDWVGIADQADYYRFSIISPTDVTLSLGRGNLVAYAIGHDSNQNGMDDRGDTLISSDGVGTQVHQLLPPGNYFVWVKNDAFSSNSDQYYSLNVVEGNANPIATPPPPTPPDPSAVIPPSGLLVMPISQSQIDVHWVDNAANETGYSIESALTAQGPWTVSKTTVANATSASVTSLASGTEYFFRVRATGTQGFSDYAGPVSGATLGTPPDMSIPAAPSGLSVTPDSQTRLDVQWLDNATNETGYSIELSTTSQGPWTVAATTPANSTTSSLGALAPATQYFIRVRATGSSGSSAFSSIASAETSGGQLPTPPSNVVATAVSQTEINVLWSDNATNEMGYSIESATSGSGPWTVVGTAPSNATNFNIAGLSESTEYFFRVRAIGSQGSSDYSAVQSGFTLSPNTSIPAAPNGLLATAVSQNRIDLMWVDNATSETGYSVEVATDAQGPWTTATTTPANITSFSVTDLVAATQYFFRVRAMGAEGNSDYSDSLAVSTPGSAQQPGDPGPAFAVTFAGAPISSSVLSGGIGLLTLNVSAVSGHPAGAAYVELFSSSDAILDNPDTAILNAPVLTHVRPGKATSLKLRFNYPAIDGPIYLLARASGTSDTTPTPRGSDAVAAIAQPVTVSRAVATISPTSLTAKPAVAIGKRGSATLLVTNSGNTPYKGVLTIALTASVDATAGNDDLPLATISKRVSVKAGLPKRIPLKFLVPANFTPSAYHLVAFVTPAAIQSVVVTGGFEVSAQAVNFSS